VALPEAEEETDPSFDNYPVHALPQARDSGTWMRLIAGDAFGLRSPVRTHSPLFYIHAQMSDGSRMGLPDGHVERAAYVVSGGLEFEGSVFRPGQMLVFAAGSAPSLRALAPSTVMLLGGESLGLRHIWWNFVSSRLERIERAKADWKAGRIALPPNDRNEFIALPE
jgi:redox-sensitive bicupin YhaK (pirin superfamily)